MEALLTKADVRREKDPEKRAVLDMAQQAQWLEARLRQVEWLRARGAAADDAAPVRPQRNVECVALDEAGVNPVEAQREAVRRLLYSAPDAGSARPPSAGATGSGEVPPLLPSEYDQRTLPPELAPYGQASPPPETTS